MRKELNDLQKIDFEKSSKLEKLQNQITQFRDEKDSLEQRVVQLNHKIEEVLKKISFFVLYFFELISFHERRRETNTRIMKKIC